jgi:integrase
MSTAFKQAVRWGMIGKNPFEGAALPHHEDQRRAIWNEETIRKALDACEGGKLFMAIHLAFACSLRFGEICGLTWDCVDISDAAIMNGDAHLHVKKVLARVHAEAIDVVGKQDILFTFPAVVSGKSRTRLVLKKPKTESSIRKIWIPETLAKLLREWKANQERLKELLGDEYTDYGLVIALENGRPCEDRVLGNAFNRLKKNAGLPNVVFHSLRHSSTTYKLKQNHGDIKATQGDTGHAQPNMVTEVYSHILDEDRRVNAQRFEAAFYANPDMREQERMLRAQSPQQQPQDVLELAKLLSENPALATLLAGILKNGTA